MQFHVGPFTYQARLVRGYVLDSGRTCLGLCDHRHRQILISDLLDPPQRLQVLCHELWHAWCYHFPAQCRDEESLADLLGLALTQLAQDVLGPACDSLTHLPYLEPETSPNPIAEPPESSHLSGKGSPPTASPPPASPPLRTATTYLIRVYEPPAPDVQRSNPSAHPSPTPPAPPSSANA